MYCTKCYINRQKNALIKMLGIPWVMGFLGTLIFLFGLYRIFYNEYINTYFTKYSLFLDQNSKVISERWFIKSKMIEAKDV